MGQRRIVQWIVFFVLVLLSIGTVHAQTPTEITIFRDEDSFTLYVSGEGSVSLQGLTLAVDDPAVTRVLQDYYPTFREIASRFDRLSLPLCLNLLRSNSDTPLAIDCQNIPREQLYIQLLADADVFWFDTQANIPLTVQVGSGTEMQFCPPGPRCQIDFTPSSNISTSSKPASAANLDEREILVLLAQFEQISGNPIEPHREWELVLSDAIRELDDQINARVLFVPQIVRTQDEARTLSDLYDATLVIWGNVRGAALESNYTITPRWSNIETSPGQTEVNGTIDELRVFVSPGGDTQYVLNFVLGQLLYFDDQRAEALSYFENAIALAPAEIERQRELGLGGVYFYKGVIHQTIETDLSKAQTAYSHLLEIDPDSTLVEEAYNNRGVVRYDQGDLTGAIADYDRAIAADPEFTAAYINRGVARRDQGDLIGAIEDYDRTIALDPQYASAYNNRGNVRRQQGDLAGAIEDYDRAVALDPQYASAYNNRGIARRQQGDLEGAIADYDRAIALNPEYAKAHNNRGNARRRQGDLAGAIADYDRAIALDPQYALAYNNRGIARRQQGDLEGAIADYDRAIVLNPEYTEAYNNRGNVRRWQGDLAGATEDYMRAIELRPEFANAYWGLGNVYYDLGEIENSLENYQRYIELAGEDNAPDWMIERISELQAQLTPTPEP